MTGLRLYALALFSLIGNPVIPSATAQAAPDSGARVRVQGRGFKTTGVLELLSPESVVISGQSYSRRLLTRLEVSAGRHSEWDTGMALGALAGGVLAGTLCLLRVGYSNEDGNLPCVAGLAGWPLLGTATGGIVGAATQRERWHSVGLQSLTVVPVVQAGGRVGFELRLHL